MPLKPKWNFDTCPTRHPWDGDVVILVRRIKRSGHIKHTGRALDFKRLGIQRGGLLEKAIVESRCPLHMSNANQFISTIKDLSTNPRIRAILGASPNTLELPDVHYLFREIDDRFKKKELKSGTPQADVVRKIITDSKYLLADGTLITHAGYTSTLQPPPRPVHTSLSSKYDPHFTDQVLALPVSATGYANPKEQDRKIARHYELRIERIIVESIATLDDHERLAKRIREVKAQGFPESLQPRTKILLVTRGRCAKKTAIKRNSEDRFRIAAYLVEYHVLYKNAPSPNLLLLTGIPDLAVLAPSTSSRLLFTALLSDYYLSRTAIIACYVILLAHTGWNNDTLLSLSIDRIRETHHGFEIVGLKSKTDQLQSAEIPSANTIDSSNTSLFIESPAATRALRLLIAHNANVDRYATRLHTSVFVSINARYSGRLAFDLIFRERHLHEFCEARGLPKFNANELRNQVAQYRYVQKERDLSVPQVTLGHKNSQITQEYVNSSIEYLSNEANLKRYMDMLGASILFISGRLSISPKDQSPEAILARTMLWPPSRFTEEDSLCRIDQWLASNGTIRLTIGVEEAQHCAYQKKFYTENLTSLIDANPDRFRKYELPRILVCYALYKLIDASPLRRQLRDCEKALYE